MNEDSKREPHTHGVGDMSELTDVQARAKSLETVLSEKGYLDPKALDAIVEAYETRIGPHNGQRVVARAWTDQNFLASLLADASAAVNSLGNVSPVGSHLIAVQNTSECHNLVVCTLCSCYPWEVLGLPPSWYKSAPYRSRAVIEPRRVLSEFGISLPKTTNIRVWDSTAETRFLVIPMRPTGTEGWTEEELAKLVTRNSMIGAGLALEPEQKS
ncbi:MAG: nitrile hydratase subunit alpha [Alphaproteobacteria bacterium]